MEMKLVTTARYNGFAHFMNSGSISAFQVEPGGTVEFASGTAASQYNFGAPLPTAPPGPSEPPPAVPLPSSALAGAALLGLLGLARIIRL